MSLKIYSNQSVYTGGLNSPVLTADVVLASDADFEIEYWKMRCGKIEALIDKLKCCGNCKHNFDADEEHCVGCCEPKLEKWEMRE
jgi:hypothetical protein